MMDAYLLRRNRTYGWEVVDLSSVPVGCGADLGREFAWKGVPYRPGPRPGLHRQTLAEALAPVVSRMPKNWTLRRIGADRAVARHRGPTRLLVYDLHRDRTYGWRLSPPRKATAGHEPDAVRREFERKCVPYRRP